MLTCVLNLKKKIFNVASTAKVISDGTYCLFASGIRTTVACIASTAMCSKNGGGIGVLYGQHIHLTDSEIVITMF